MIAIYRCNIELHDNLYFATRELGRLYETEPIIHNYALSYALGLVDSERYGTTVAEENAYRYFCQEQIPKYEQHLMPLNQQGIYITPARSLNHVTVLQTWKYADNRYHVEMQKTQKNIPSFGRNKEIAPESQFEFFAICQNPITLPKWIRLGKWASKAQVTQKELTSIQRRNGTFIFPYPLNPLDVMFAHQVMTYDVINMPPVSLIENTKMQGQYYEADGIEIPAGMEYRFGS
ncbi:type I-D CRISPR-associated protein Cas5/Csc1 [Geitlerinema sp. PCC 9228]|jgi:CRISPR-associated protein Csc1|uniref:type I-D CRISPR-associated protein Cas5/Csc1 n=1 Tax=Geitlerinema sp. PCC 9228 TaxID=111611 RepID=UPI0008F993DF|nr:type I-D CRISPR-associated protein Cas5/Csc1 [Geitlerinema sp. PCC 9228]